MANVQVGMSAKGLAPGVESRRFTRAAGDSTAAASNVRFGSWLCEKSSSCRAHGMILAQLPSGELNHTVRLMHDTGLENRIFYISAMYEFSHSLGHER
jgi:hypothetical protein